jgi:hypothetical protein
MTKGCGLAALALVVGCSGSPAAPSGPKVTSITVTGADLLLIGKSETFTVTTDVPVAVRWGSDAPGVAVVDPTSGRVSAVGTGTATIYADANGVRGTKLIRTLPDFEGGGSIYYRLAKCEAGGSRSCFPTAEMYLKLVQNRDSISGSFSMTDWYSYDFRNDDVTGSVSSDGWLSFTASATSGESLRIENVRVEMRPDRRLAGTFEHVHSDERGSVRYFYEATGSTLWR